MFQFVIICAATLAQANDPTAALAGSSGRVKQPGETAEQFRMRAASVEEQPLRGQTLNEEILRVLDGEGLRGDALTDALRKATAGAKIQPHLNDANRTLKGLEETQRRVATLQRALDSSESARTGRSGLNRGVAVVLGFSLFALGLCIGVLFVSTGAADWAETMLKNLNADTKQEQSA